MPKTNQISKAKSDIRIKVCGLSSREAVDAAVDAGASHIGLVHFEKSPRHVDLGQAAALREYADGRVRTVLLLVNASAEDTARAMNIVQPDIVQFHGTETPEWLRLIRKFSDVRIWKALGVKDADTLPASARFVGAADRLLFDAPAQALPGGTGISFNWDLLAGFDHRLPWILAGGLDADNVGDAIAATGTDFVDVSSGIESAPGVKDVAKIHQFCEAVRQYEQSRTKTEQLP